MEKAPPNYTTFFQRARRHPSLALHDASCSVVAQQGVLRAQTEALEPRWPSRGRSAPQLGGDGVAGALSSSVCCKGSVRTPGPAATHVRASGAPDEGNSRRTSRESHQLQQQEPQTRLLGRAVSACIPMGFVPHGAPRQDISNKEMLTKSSKSLQRGWCVGTISRALASPLSCQPEGQERMRILERSPWVPSFARCIAMDTLQRERGAQHGGLMPATACPRLT